MKRYVITTLVSGAKINDNFYKSILNYCNREKAKLIMLPTNIEQLSPKQSVDTRIAKDNINLNANLTLSLLPISPEQIDPITGLERLGKENRSFIYASPKQRLKSVASPSESLPRVIMTPGAITNPLPKTSKRALIANRDHVFGALIIEVESSSIFHFRQVQADRNGSFIDLAKEYAADGKMRNIELEALIPGDYHAGFTDPKVKEILIKVLETYKPKHLVLHDFFDGISVNHHLDMKILSKAQLGGLNDLTAELHLASNELKQLAKKAKNVVVVKSNHDEFLDRWLNEAKYVHDARNHIIGLELALAKAQGKDPIEYGLKKYQTFPNVTFLKSDESFKVSNKRIECGAHGHRGANGSRGSVNNLERCYQNVIYGHSHSPEILRGAWVVGTSTYLKLGYNEGPSSWMQTFCLVYPNGSRQLINVVKGKCVV